MYVHRHSEHQQIIMEEIIKYLFKKNKYHRVQPMHNMQNRILHINMINSILSITRVRSWIRFQLVGLNMKNNIWIKVKKNEITLQGTHIMNWRWWYFYIIYNFFFHFSSCTLLTLAITIANGCCCDAFHYASMSLIFDSSIHRFQRFHLYEYLIRIWVSIKNQHATSTTTTKL